MNRRSFIKAVSAATAMVGCSPSQGIAGNPGSVVVIRREGLSKLSGKAKNTAYTEMLDTAFSLLGADCLGSALGGRKRVGLKVNCLAGKPLSPCPEMISALAGFLLDSGAREISVWERSLRELQRAGYDAKGGPGYEVRATDERDMGYDRRINESGDVGSLLSNVMLYNEAMVSVGVIKDHDLAGISCSLKNLYGVIHNPNKYHDFGCDPYVAQVAAMRPVRERLFLTVLDGSTAQCHGGPAYKSGWAWALDSILVSFDSVASDGVALGIIEKERERRELPTLEQAKRFPKWIATAASMGLGKSEPLLIERSG